jgi:hypothetical protein
MIARRTLLAAPFAVPLRAAAPRVLERYLAVDNVCAWPKLTVLPGGVLAAAIFSQPSHGGAQGDVACYTSADGGRNWALAGVPAPHESGTLRANHAIGIANNGDLIVLAAGWKLNSANKKVHLLPCWVCRSSDAGKTWTRIDRFPAGPDNYVLVPFGNISPGADGALRVSAYVYRADRNPRVDTCVVLRSPDDGRSWQIFGEIGNRVHNETDIAHLGRGRWLAAARALSAPGAPKAHTTDILVSEDDAKTWRTAGLSTAGDELPGDLCVLRDGRVVFTYGSRRTGQYGTIARVSTDSGRNWSEPYELASYTNRDSGYPSTVETREGHLVTAYYARSSREHHRYHMGVVLWESKG